jgi:hypothetical protein
MITQNLIELLESGQAQYKTHSLGIAGASYIPVPKNNYIVIVDFTFSHFIDRDWTIPPPPSQFEDKEYLNNCIHHVEFRSQGQAYPFTFRTNFDIISVDKQPYMMPRNNNEHIQTYQVHKTDVHIDIWRLNNRAFWNITYGLLPDKTNEDKQNVGYATLNTGGLVTLLNFNYEGAITFYPFGILQAGVGDVWTSEFRAPVSLRTALFPIDISKDQTNYNFPILNISYVLVNHAWTKDKR